MFFFAELCSLASCCTISQRASGLLVPKLPSHRGFRFGGKRLKPIAFLGRGLWPVAQRDRERWEQPRAISQSQQTSKSKPAMTTELAQGRTQSGREIGPEWQNPFSFRVFAVFSSRVGLMSSTVLSRHSSRLGRRLPPRSQALGSDATPHGRCHLDGLWQLESHVFEPYYWP